MKKIIFVFAPLLIILIGCSKSTSESDTSDQEQTTEEKKTYFTINVADNYFTNEAFTEDYFSVKTEGWIVSQDVETGDILDYKRLNNGSKIELERPTSSSNIVHNVSLIIISKSTGNTYHQIASYDNIKPDAVWNLYENSAYEATTSEDQYGEISISANYLISPVSFNLSNKYGSANSGSGSSSTVNQLTNMDFSYNIPLLEENRFLFSIFDSYGDGTYIFLDDVVDGQSITFDRTQMQSFDKTIPVYIPDGGVFFSTVLGFDQDQEYSEGGGYILNMLFPWDFDEIFSNSINLGYLNSFDKYITKFTYTKDNIYYSYNKYGEIPLGISFGDLEAWNLDVEDNAIDNFQFSGISSNLISRQNHLWRTSSGSQNIDYTETSWTINQANSYYAFNFQLPEEILSTYPELDIDDLNYYNSTFHLNDYTYQDFIDAIYVNPNSELLLQSEFYRISN